MDIILSEASNSERVTEEYFEPKLLGKYPGRQTDTAMTCLTYLSLDAFKVGYTSNDK